MSSIQVRAVNVVPVTKIKLEKLDDEELEDTVLCRLCSKAFVSEMAVRNHARMEHIEEFEAGADLYMKSEYSGLKRKYTEDIQNISSELVSSMEPTAVTSLASKDVSYIIIKDQDAMTVQKMRKLRNSVKQAKSEKQVTKKEKEVVPISGPFECLQPSTSNPEEVCHQMFLSCCEYSAHFRDEHTRRRKGSRCQVCEKFIAAYDNLTPYSCQLCSMVFENSKDMTEHSQTAHIKLKPFQCSVCLKRFTQQGGLQQHMRRHTGDRPFPCTYCTKAFTQKSGLDQHLRIHTKEKPYRCVICSKAFCQSVHLQQHMRTHTNVAPFQCGICQKRFKQSSHLNYHLRYHNMVKMTDEQKLKYAALMSEMTKQDYVEVEVDPALTSQVIDQSEIQEEEIDQSEMAQDEIDQSESQQSDNNEETGETVYIMEESDMWCESVVCEQ
ncbi:zinc finger protein 235-like isoform X2 [Maniola jurtina]|uniref:zinc finger protein 235-like isoform X2 n=1 Tax=Maniola jurtina TaxID=191418 RepID=UPI001E687680|nr:zinc finger protein 235-like isoform X2 [Maniola jurtina]